MEFTEHVGVVKLWTRLSIPALDEATPFDVQCSPTSLLFFPLSYSSYHTDFCESGAFGRNGVCRHDDAGTAQPYKLVLQEASQVYLTGILPIPPRCYFTPYIPIRLSDMSKSKIFGNL